MNFLEGTGLMFWIVCGFMIIRELAFLFRDLGRKFQKWRKK